jgi:hypothetical protein
MRLNQAIAALEDANRCIDIGQYDTARELLAESRRLMDEPSVLDAYEQTSATAHLGEFSE